MKKSYSIMKVRSRLNSKQQKHSHITRVLVFAVGILGLGLLLPRLFFLIGTAVLYPVHSTNNWLQTSQSRLPMFLREQNELITEIKNLENQLAVAMSTDLTQQRLFEENIRLRQLLSVNETGRIAAAVIARPTQLPYDLMQIDKGKEAGIQVGAPVYIGADNVIGIVTFTAPTYSFVELFTTPGFTATSFVSGANIIATLEGFGSGVARVRVPQGIPLRTGNLVHLPSLEPGVFGRIEYIENEPTQPEQYGYITIPQPISAIRYVAVGATVVPPANVPLIEEKIRSQIKASLVFESNDTSLLSATSTATTTATSTNTL